VDFSESSVGSTSDHNGIQAWCDATPASVVKPKSARPKEPKPEVNAVIVSWLCERLSAEDPYNYHAFTHSKGKSLPIQDLLRGYRYTARVISQYNDTRTPTELEGAPDRKISKVS
jgi:hypothetical protein